MINQALTTHFDNLFGVLFHFDFNCCQLGSEQGGGADPCIVTLQGTRRLSENSARSEDCEKLRIKFLLLRRIAGLFDEDAGIFRPIYRNRTTAGMQELEQRRSSYRVGQRTASWCR